MTTDEKMAAMQKKFKSLDTNGDGTLDLSELKSMLMKGDKNMTAADCETLYNTCDTNHDGKISFEEFLHFVYKGDHSRNRSTEGRHQRLAAQGGPVDDGTETDWEPCKEVFRAFAGEDMDNKEFAKFCNDNKLYQKKTKTTAGFQQVDCDLLFSKIVPKGKRRMNFDMFKDACRIIAEKRGVSNRTIQDIVSDSSGPKLVGTQADYVKFHDDKTTYTGAHIHNEKHGENVGSTDHVGRSDRIKQDHEDNLNAGDEDDWGPCDKVFQRFAASGASASTGELDGREFANLCREVPNLLKKPFFGETDIDVVFAKGARGAKTINFDRFKVCVREIAVKKGQETYACQACIARCKGPQMHGTTKAEYNKFHDDPDQYTGTHVGKPC